MTSERGERALPEREPCGRGVIAPREVLPLVRARLTKMEIRLARQYDGSCVDERARNDAALYGKGMTEEL